MATDRLLVTGATGFVGRWVLQHWRTAHPEVEVWATSDQSARLNGLSNRFLVFDLRDANTVREFVCECNPTHVIHLAGLVSEASLAEHLAVNVLGTENLYNALVKTERFVEMRVVQAGTAAIYGEVAPEELPISERNPLRPITAYGLSKMTQDYLAEMFWRTRGLHICRVRIFNLLGPGQPDYLVPAAFVKQIKTMCNGESLRVGNLAARRDFVDVRDVIVAFDKLINRGQPPRAYNIASGRSVAIRDVVNELLSISGLHDIRIKEEPIRMRNNDLPDVVADITAIAEDAGWQPQISLRESLEAMWNNR